MPLARAGTHGVCERLERRDSDNGLLMSEREALHGGDADPQPGERARARADRIERHVRKREVARAEEFKDLAGQAPRVRHVRGADAFLEQYAITSDGDAAGVRGGVEREDGHVAPL